jgi:hypothetical protein
VVDNIENYLDIRVKGPKSWASPQIFIKVPNIKFQTNPSSGSRADIDVNEEGNGRFSRLPERAFW